ncbi:MAG: hypothetical protein PHO12_08435 [Bacteroidales bacterium]|nr:hypothetical protein [Bacteroidales bacterium]MDD4683978.1 hypothetical protein [Bacteroidales bacterium]
MKTIKIIENLYITKDGLRTKLKNGRFQIAHLQQGSLDGACAIYSVSMNLLLIGAIKYSDIRINGNEYDKRSGIERLKKEFFERKGLHREGIDYLVLQYAIKSSFSKYITVEHFSADNSEDIINRIDDNIQNNFPVTISIEFKGGAHALLAVGMEYEDEKPIKILCLDPDSKSPNMSYWNSEIALFENKGKYNHIFMDANGSIYNVQLDDILEIRKKHIVRSKKEK